jgi:cob(I)alamin adenosyltransferase
VVDFVQFLKSGRSSEVAIFKNIENIRYYCPGEHPFIMGKSPQPIHYQHAQKAYKRVLNAVKNGSQLLVCDEILDTIIFNLLKVEQLIDLAKQCKNNVELVMTGRHVPPDILEMADYATEMVDVKHPYYEGTRARKGIEY